MLKIAEYNTITGKKVELSELAKYGFIKDNYNVLYNYQQNRFTGIRIEKETRRIGIYNSADIIVEKETLTKLYDLIKDGYVVKE